MDNLNFRIGEMIRGDLKVLARKVVEQQYQDMPELWERYGDYGYEKCVQDTELHLAYLAEAVTASSEALFVDYVRWAAVLLEAFKVPKKDFAANLLATALVFQFHLASEEVPVVWGYLNLAMLELSSAAAPTSFIAPDAPLAPLAADYLSALLHADTRTAASRIDQAIKDSVSVRDIYLYVFQPTQRELGLLWQTNQISVAQEHFCTASTQRIMAQLSRSSSVMPHQHHSIVAACIGGETHDMGIRMVTDFFEMDGWDTFYVGANTPTRSLLSLMLERKPDILALSATITPHLKNVREVIGAVRAREELRGVKILVGGYPFIVSPYLWQDVGADGCARDGSSAVAVADSLVGVSLS